MHDTGADVRAVGIAVDKSIVAPDIDALAHAERGADDGSAL